jgi:hypothetical protein
MYNRMVRNSRRNGPTSRLFSPINEGLGLVTRTGSRALSMTNSAWRTLGNGVRSTVSNATRSLNTAGRRLLTGKRGGARRTRKHRTRKHRRRH